LLLFLITVFKHIDAFDPSWHKFKNFVMLEIMLLHLQAIYIYLLLWVCSLSDVASADQKNICRKVWSFSAHCNCTQRTSETTAVAVVSLGIYEPSTLLFGLQKQHCAMVISGSGCL